MKNPWILVLLLLLFIVPPIWLSVELWNSHPREFDCSVPGEACKLISYKYKHEICWSYMYHSRYTVSSCKIPRYKDKEYGLFPLYDINTCVVKGNGSSYDLYLLDNSSNEKYMTSYKTKKSADFVSKNLNAHVKRWQEGPSNPELSVKIEYKYQFFED